MRRRLLEELAVLLLVVLATVACQQQEEDEGPYAYVPPAQTGDGWPTGDLAGEGIDVAPIEALVRGVRDGSWTNIHAVVLVRHGRLLLEEYFPGMGIDQVYARYDRDTLHELHSVTKSVNATLVGTLACDGRIAGLDEPVTAFFPDYEESANEAAKREIRLRHLLTMTAGLQWDETSFPYGDPRNSASGIEDAAQPIRWILARPLVAPPGRDFVYNSGLSVTLGGVVARATGQPTEAYAAERLFSPLGIASWEWHRYADGSVNAGGGLHLRPRDMAKIGQLHLDGGTWGGRRVVCGDWVEAATSQQVKGIDYGYQWWLTTFEVVGRSERSFYASGRGGQFVFVVPGLSLVAVFTGGNADERYLQPFDMMKRHVLPAVH